MLKMLLSAIRSIKLVILIWSPSMFRSSLIHPKICIWISGVAKFGVFVERSLNVSSHIQEHGMKFLPYLPFLFLTEISSFTVGTLYLADEQNHAQKFSCICFGFLQTNVCINLLFFVISAIGTYFDLIEITNGNIDFIY